MGNYSVKVLYIETGKLRDQHGWDAQIRMCNLELKVYDNILSMAEQSYECAEITRVIDPIVAAFRKKLLASVRLLRYSTEDYYCD